MAAVLSSHMQVIIMPPGHFSIFMVQRGAIIMADIIGDMAGIMDDMPGIMDDMPGIMPIVPPIMEGIEGDMAGMMAGIIPIMVMRSVVVIIGIFLAAVKPSSGWCVFDGR